MTEELHVTLLGSPSVTLGERQVTGFVSSKAQALVYYLAATGQPHTRDALAGLLWSDVPNATARKNLRDVLSNLRRLIAPYLLITRQKVRFNPESPHVVDSQCLSATLSSSQRTGSSAAPPTLEDMASLSDAVALYQGEFLAGFYVPEAPLFEEWVLVEREHLRRELESALERLVDGHSARGKYKRAIAYAQRWLSLDPLREAAQRSLMRLYAWDGDRAAALRQYQKCVEVLEEELGVEPAPETRALYERIRAGEFRGGAVERRERVIRGYELRERIGAGGFGVVYRAYQPAVGREVAIKAILPEYANHPDFIRRFEAEAQLVARLEHLHIVPLYDYWREPDGAYLVMRWLRGGNLREALQRGPWKPEAAARLLDQIASALTVAHHQGVVHRDVKPENILLDEEGNGYLSDFGIAKDPMRATGATEPGAVVGSPAYISPEQARGKPITPQSDLYSLGVVMYQVLTGEHPFPGVTPAEQLVKHLTEPLPSLRERRPDLPEGLEEVIQRATAKDAAARFPDALSFATAFREAVSGVAVPAAPPTPGPAGIERLAIGTIGVSFDDLRKEQVKRSDAPFQAPPDVPRFVGREKEAVEFRDVLAHATGQNLYCLTGMGGIGKTALAIHLAHTLQDYSADGVLWANAATSEPLAILDSWARAYDCDFSGLPDLDSRAAALRGLLADKKVLVVLDDVRSAEQVRPLLPSGSQCTVLLTTRDLELGVALNAHVRTLSPLTPVEGRQLMSRIVGDERVVDEEESASEICQLLGNLPLAVEIVAKRLTSRPRWRLAKMAERLRDAKNRLELKISDREVWASFGVSWEALDEDLRRRFALLAVFEGRPFTAPALAAVAEIDGRTAEDSLHALVVLSLVSEEGEVRYRQHPLLADFAREQLGRDEAAYARMAQYYLEYATERQRDYVELEQEWDNLSASMRVAHRQEMWQVIVDFGRVLADAWFARARFSDARQGYEWACGAARALEDRRALASCLCQWGQACIEQGDYAEAEEHLSRSFQVWEELDDRCGVASAQYYLGRTAIEQANFDEAQQLLAESRRIREGLGDKAGVAESLYQQAHIPYGNRNYEEAKQLGRQALGLQQAVGDKLGCVRTLGLLADIAINQDDHDLGEQYCRRALALCEEIQEQGELAVILYILSKAPWRRGDLRSARDYAERSLALLTRMGDRKMQARALRRLSLIDADLKDYALALEEGLQSLNLRRELEDTWGMIYTLLHLGDVHQALDQPAQAHEMWSEALGLADGLQHPLTEPLQERLDAIT